MRSPTLNKCAYLLAYSQRKEARKGPAALPRLSVCLPLHDESNSEQMFMKFHAGCFKNPQYIPIVDKLHNMNWVLFIGGMRLGCEVDNLPIYVTS